MAVDRLLPWFESWRHRWAFVGILFAVEAVAVAIVNVASFSFSIVDIAWMSFIIPFLSVLKYVAITLLSGIGKRKAINARAYAVVTVVLLLLDVWLIAAALTSRSGPDFSGALAFFGFNGYLLLLAPMAYAFLDMVLYIMAKKV